MTLGPRICTLAVVSLLAAAPLVAQKAPAKGRTRQIFVSVVDRAGAPVLDLQPADFDVIEGGVKRTIVRAGLATSPMRVGLLVDTSDAAAPALNQIRAALAQFLDALPPEHEVVLLSTGLQLRVRVPPTFNRGKLKDAAAGLFTDGGGTALMDGVLETDDRFMKKAENRWPVFVILTSDGAENSAGAHENEFNRWLASIGPRGISGHVIVIKSRGNGLTEIVANSIAENSGGRYDVVNTASSLPDKMKALASSLADDFNVARTRYQVDFASDSPANASVDVGVAREGITLKITQTRLR